MLVIVLLAVLWFGLVPVAGAFAERKKWRYFRRRFGELRQKQPLEYASLVGGDQQEYRFNGFYESAGEGVLWIRSDELTVTADLRGADIYMLPNVGSENNPAVFDPDEVPVKIRWNRISGLAREAKVFAGGSLVAENSRRVFASVPDKPLFIVFYEGSEKALPVRAVRAGRHKNEYFNFITPYAFILGFFSQIIIAIFYLPRPAHRLTMIGALIAAFTPLLPWVPPGILFTILYRRLWMQARIYRAGRDLALMSAADDRPADPLSQARQYNRKAHIFEIISWLLLLCGIGVNVFFITVIITLVV